MLNKDDLLKLKEENEKTLIENNAVICEKQKINNELEAENRVFDKLIALFDTPAVNTACENTIED